MRTIVKSLPTLLAAAVLFALTSCSPGGYGKLRLQDAGTGKTTPEALLQAWNDYEVYYSGIETYRPSAVLFDPKGDTKRMEVHPWWVRITDQRVLQEVLDWMSFDLDFDPVVWRILGPDNDFYAYLYTAWGHALIRAVDEDTLWIDEMSIPPDHPAGMDTVMAPGV